MMDCDDILRFIDISKFKSILCLDGNLPESRLFKKFNLPIIAADGSANRLNSIGISPDFIIGDCDSVSEKLLENIPHRKITDQNTSDFQKAMRYLENKNLLPTIICGISGGYLDHIINNVGIFMEHSENVFIDNEIVGYNLTTSHQFNFPLNTKISIIGMPECRLTTKGLKWEMNNLKLSFPGNSSYFNRCISENLKIIIHEGKALMIVYLEKIIDAGLKQI